MTEDERMARRALYLALTIYLEPDDAHQAISMWTWPQGAGSSVLSGLSRYCRDVSHQFGLKGREAELHLSIIKLMKSQGLVGGPVVRQQDDQRTPMEPGSLGAQDSSLPAGVSAITVQRFLEAVEASVAQESPQTYSPRLWRQALMRHATQLKPYQSSQIADWLWGHTAQLAGEWPARGPGTRLVNAAYVSLAEWLGPVKADACFTGIVNEFENSGDPLLSSIRKYL